MNRRFIIEMGSGSDLHGQDHGKAALRAVKSALQGASLGVLGLDPGLRDALHVKVTVGVQNPDAVDRAAIAACLPVGHVEVIVVTGGLDVTPQPGGEPIVVASAAIEAFLPDNPGGYRAV
ncbi:hypothetical protein FLO80_13990 [Aquicoccus porphyridii]|uniref:Uncharacterized protein n=1 Tax=Aquicoccus porphyridii TaxID=1852029 RepID=A0A5A9Z6X3_9RHOB|nr:Lin0512 family protein [Aquicoccus porphyridii]KAA0912936.1 hypothetical protein FLO80_13990 [Aquicoccus porphyridii]RAI54324.1 hypothetical protein DOO74_08815 [Rhodobacteraceae bacterium AsT-22]